MNLVTLYYFMTSNDKNKLNYHQPSNYFAILKDIIKKILGFNLVKYNSNAQKITFSQLCLASLGFSK